MKVSGFDTLHFRMHSDCTMDNATAGSRTLEGPVAFHSVVGVILTPILPL